MGRSGSNVLVTAPPIGSAGTDVRIDRSGTQGGNGRPHLVFVDFTLSPDERFRSLKQHVGSHRCSLHLFDEWAIVHFDLGDGRGVVCGYDADAATHLSSFAELAGSHVDAVFRNGHATGDERGQSSEDGDEPSFVDGIEPSSEDIEWVSPATAAERPD